MAQGANWFEAFAGHSYFEDIGRASPLRHLWSLGVEAQFYAVWPLVAAVALRHGGRRALTRVALTGAAASFLAMALLFRTGHDPSRIYFGTDTRAGTLLLGAALALGWRRLQPSARVTDVAGVASLVGLGVLALHLDGSTASAYRGGLLLAALLAAVVLAALLQPDGRLGRAFSQRPLVWLGTRSYAIYLWHWPVIVATRPGLDVDAHGWALLALRLGSTLVLAEATTRLAGLLVRSAWHAHPARAHRLVLASVGILIVVAALTIQSTSPAPAFYVSPTTALAMVTTTTEAPTTTVAVESVTTLAPVTTTAAPVFHLPPPPSGLPPVPPDMPPATGDVRAVAVGESVLVAAGGEVQRAVGPGTVVDADIARQPDDVLRRLAARRAAGYLDHAGLVVIQMGTNGAIDMRRMERMAELVVGVPRIVAVTVHVDRPWAAQSNAALREGAARWPWLRLAEWDAAASEHPEWLGSDGVHPNREGARQYAALVEAAATAP